MFKNYEKIYLLLTNEGLETIMNTKKGMKQNGTIGKRRNKEQTITKKNSLNPTQHLGLVTNFAIKPISISI